MIAMTTLELPPLPKEYIDAVARAQVPFLGTEYADYLLAFLEKAVLDRIAEIRKEEGVVPGMSA